MLESSARVGVGGSRWSASLLGMALFYEAMSLWQQRPPLDDICKMLVVAAGAIGVRALAIAFCK